MIVDAVEDFGQPGLRIEAVHLGCLDKGHRPGQRFATAVGACKKPVFSPDAQFPFILPMSGRFIVSIIDGMPILART